MLNELCKAILTFPARRHYTGNYNNIIYNIIIINIIQKLSKIIPIFFFFFFFCEPTDVTCTLLLCANLNQSGYYNSLIHHHKLRSVINAFSLYRWFHSKAGLRIQPVRFPLTSVL